MAESSSSPLDPFALWRDLVTQMSRDANQWANRGMATDEFAEVLHKLLGPTVAFGKLSTKAKQRWFEAMNLPSRADVAALGDRLQVIEDKLIDLVAAVERNQGGATAARASAREAAGNSPATRLPRTRKPPPEPAEAVALPAAPPAPRRAAPRKRKARA